MIIIWNLLGLLISATINLSSCEDELILVHVIFRHGHRTPDLESIYPNDPYANESYHPFGYGQLTNKGKLHEYKLGQYLRKRYDEFLGDTYTPELIDPRSTDVNRTKMSLELVLAGLFPPNDEQMWLNGLNWQPIPYNYWPVEDDLINWGALCPAYLKYFEEYLDTDEYQTLYDENLELLQYLQENSGSNITTPLDVLNLYYCLETEYYWGFELPEWAAKIVSDQFKDMAILAYHVNSATTGLKKLLTGYHLKKIVDDSIAKLNGTLSPEERKMFLYSAHDINVAGFVQILGVMLDEIPHFGACVMVELHQIDGTYGFKFYFENDLEKEPALLEMPDCGEFCPVDEFVKQYEKYFPGPNSCYQTE